MGCECGESHLHRPDLHISQQNIPFVFIERTVYLISSSIALIYLHVFHIPRPNILLSFLVVTNVFRICFALPACNFNSKIVQMNFPSCNLSPGKNAASSCLPTKILASLREATVSNNRMPSANTESWSSVWKNSHSLLMGDKRHSFA